jgi:hypothetical protein
MRPERSIDAHIARTETPHRPTTKTKWQRVTYVWVLSLTRHSFIQRRFFFYNQNDDDTDGRDAWIPS